MSQSSPDRHEAFRALFERHSRPLFSFFRRRGFGVEESRDLAQETLLRAYTGLDSFRGEASERTWVLKIALNVLRNSVRARRAGKREGHEVPLDDALEHARHAPAAPGLRGRSADGPLEHVLNRERQALLRTALAELPPQMRRCMLLYVDQDLKYHEIAALMCISIGAVKSQLHEARQRLRVRLHPHVVGGDV